MPTRKSSACHRGGGRPTTHNFIRVAALFFQLQIRLFSTKRLLTVIHTIIIFFERIKDKKWQQLCGWLILCSQFVDDDDCCDGKLFLSSYANSEKKAQWIITLWTASLSCSSKLVASDDEIIRWLSHSTGIYSHFRNDRLVDKELKRGYCAKLIRSRLFPARGFNCEENIHRP